jgi:hypothetical protein
MVIARVRSLNRRGASVRRFGISSRSAGVSRSDPHFG